MGSLPIINHNVIAAELGVAEAGHLSGLKNIPPETAVSLDANEEKIAKHLTEICNQGREQAGELVTALHARQKEISISAIIDAVMNLMPGTQINIDRLLADEHEHVLEVRREERKMLRMLNYFIESNQIKHEPHYPESNLFHWGIIVALVFAETLLNGYFFAKGNELGLLGGTFQALTIAIANVGPGLLLGAFLRNFHHIDVQKKQLAGLGLSVWVGWAMFFNLLVAHYRVELELDPFKAIVNAIPHLFTKTFEIANIEAWVLFVIGLICSVFAQVKSFYADDRYPGYGREHRRYIQARKLYEAQKQHLRDSISAIIDKSRKELEQHVSDARQACNEYPVLIEQIEGLLQEYEAFEQAVEDAWQALLKTYRISNMKVRSSPEPSYFDEYSRLCPHVALRVASSEVYRKRAAELDGELEKLTTLSREVLNGLKQLNEQVLASIENFLKKIEVEADNAPEEEGRVGLRISRQKK